MKALTQFEQETLDKSVDMVMKAIIESGIDQAKVLNILRNANKKLSASAKPAVKAA